MKKQRNTAQKRIILGALECADHPTATELYEAVRRENEHISKATVFRVLAQSAENGDILKVHLCGSDERYDGTVAPHAHVRCVYCGRIKDVSLPRTAEVFGVKSAEGFEIFSAELGFSGCCPDCAARRAEEVKAGGRA